MNIHFNNSPYVIKCITLLLSFSSGIKQTLVGIIIIYYLASLLVPKSVIVSRYLTYMAVLESKYSAASLINFAASTSALAVISLACDILYSVAAEDSASCRSLANRTSLMYMLSMMTPLITYYKTHQYQSSTYFST